MHFLLQKALSLLFLATPGLSTPVQQSPLSPSCHSEVGTISEIDLAADAVFGYQGPGVYHILSAVDRYQVSLGSEGSGDGVPVELWKANETQSQLWFISDVGGGQVTITNNRTGVLLAATASRKEVSTFATSPGDLRTHWTFSDFSSIRIPNNATRLTNVKFGNEVFFAYRRIPHEDGAKVHIWPILSDYIAAAWLLHYMGAS